MSIKQDLLYTLGATGIAAAVFGLAATSVMLNEPLSASEQKARKDCVAIQSGKKQADILQQLGCAIPATGFNLHIR